MYSSHKKFFLIILLVFVVPVTWAKNTSTKEPVSFDSAQKAYEKNDVVTALMMWLPLAEAGDKRSQFALGKIYLEYNDVENAIYWYQQAANQGELASQTTLGLLYSEGKQVDKNPQLAAKYLLMATRNRQISARLDNADDAKPPASEKNKLSDYEKGMAAYQKKDYTSALMAWLPLGTSGDSNTEYMIGKMYLEQSGERKDPHKAAYWFRRAGDHDHLAAQTELGLMYFHGDMIQQDLVQAARWLLKASRNKNQPLANKKEQKETVNSRRVKTLPPFNKGMIAYQKKDYLTALMHWYPLGMQGNVEAQFMLGNLYMREEGIYKNPQKGLAWYERAISQDDIKTTKSLGLMYLFGDDTDKDTSKAIKLLLKAARLGDADSQFMLANIYLKGESVKTNAPKAAYWYQMAASQQHAEAQFLLAEMYMHGQGIQKNIAKALELYKAADKNKHYKASVVLGKNYYHDLKKPNYKKAFNMFSKAAEQGDMEAQFFLGEMYFNGKGAAKNLKQAFDWYLKAASQSHTDAEYSLGKMYVNAYGVKRNFRKGVAYFKKAAEKGHGAAQKELGIAYYSSQGVERDLVTAYAWFYLADRKGVEGAYKNKNQVYKNLSVPDRKQANALVNDFVKKYK